jgi:hypothetical protein
VGTFKAIVTILDVENGCKNTGLNRVTAVVGADVPVIALVGRHAFTHSVVAMITLRTGVIVGANFIDGRPRTLSVLEHA